MNFGIGLNAVQTKAMALTNIPIVCRVCLMVHSSLINGGTQGRPHASTQGANAPRPRAPNSSRKPTSPRHERCSRTTEPTVPRLSESLPTAFLACSKVQRRNSPRRARRPEARHAPADNDRWQGGNAPRPHDLARQAPGSGAFEAGAAIRQCRGPPPRLPVEPSFVAPPPPVSPRRPAHGSAWRTQPLPER